MVELLFKDPPFWGAAVLFIFSTSVFIWSVAGLRAHGVLKSRGTPSLSSRDFPSVTVPPPIVDKKSLWTFPPPEQPPDILPDMPPSSKPPAATSPSKPSGPIPPLSPLLPGKGDSTIVLSVMEDKFSEMTKRMTALEHSKTAPPYLEPLLKRVQDIEAEVKNLKFGFSQLSAAQNAININDVTAKIATIQKMLENLTGGTDVSKPA